MLNPTASRWLVDVLLLFVAAYVLPRLAGVVRIREREVGIVVKKFAWRTLAPGRLVALQGEAGYQARTLSPGLHFGFWPWQYAVHKVPVTVIPPGQIGLVVAADGAPIPPHRILGARVPCDDFQDAPRFLTGGGQKGRQIALLTAGTYRIHTVLFTTIAREKTGT